MFTVLIRKPELVVEHLAGYAALAHEEVASLGTQLVLRAVAWGAMVVMALVFLILTGVAVMLAFALPYFHWALVAVPAVTLIATIACFLYAKTPATGARFEGLKAQIDADVQAMRIAGERK
ncbi:hypothetical protein GN316_14835 [Xylophilus sp. Kf1]|nr:hypothetical protein [Xylophilus sp. Kf1]